MNILIRPVTTQDILTVSNLGSCNYPENLHQNDTAFKSKITAGWSWVAEVDSYLVSYLIAFPYRLGEAFPSTAPYTPPPAPDCLYIHDLCVSARFRGLGIGRRLVEQALSTPWQSFSLVAVLNSHPFWTKMGFEEKRVLNYAHGLGVYMELER